jgi:large subunit ribosomal protein L18
MDHQKAKHRQQLRRRNHVRRRITGTAERPRLSVHRSSKHIYAQLIDDLNGVTLAAAGSNGKAVKASIPYGGNVKAAAAVGKLLAEAAAAKGITKAAFDRGHYRFHGRVKALAEAANAAGLLCTEHKPKKKAALAAAAAAAAPEPVAAAAGGGGKKKEKAKK